MSAEEAELTEAERAAFDDMAKWFPGTTRKRHAHGTSPGPLEPHVPESRQHYEELLVEQTKLARDAEPSILEKADAVLGESDGFRLVPLDLAGLLADGIPETDWLDFPYVPAAARVWVFGPAESAKTLYFQWTAARLTRAGRSVVFLSQENPLATDVDRMGRLRPDHERLRYFHNPGLDLADPEHFTELALACAEADLLVVDTLSASWSGDEASNADVVKLDREVLAQLVRLAGVATVMIHHTGHPQAFVNRGGVGAGRGASAMGQKADTVLVFSSAGPKEFTIDHAKNRTPGGHKEPRTRFRVTDTPDGGLEIERVGKAIPERIAEAMDTAVEIVSSSGDGLGTNGLHEALKAQGFGSATVDQALAELRKEDPARVRQDDGQVLGKDGRYRKGRPWVTA
jgi:hypothetical protein